MGGLNKDMGASHGRPSPRGAGTEESFIHLDGVGEQAEAPRK